MVKARAIFISDVHLSVKPPALRAEEPDWFQAMARPLRELRQLAKKLNVPVICSGDVFDKWLSPPELITFAMQELPEMYSVPGQHDLPYHSYENIEESAYYCLVEAGVIKNLEPTSKVRTEFLELYGFPWAHELEANKEKSDLMKIAVVHAYVWVGKYKYETAPEDQHIKNFATEGYDAVVFGDNHQGFVQGKVCNTGGFMRRHKSDLDREPFIGVLMSDGTIKKHLLDTSDDIYCETSAGSSTLAATGTLDLGDFTDGLLNLRTSGDLDFGQVVKRYCRKQGIRQEVVNVIKETIESER